MLIVISSKSRFASLREMETNPGNSATHGGHHVAHTLISRTFLVPFFASLATPATSIVSSVTGALLHWTSALATLPLCSSHLVEQPIGRVVSTGTGLPASSASIAFCASVDLTV